MSDKKTAKIILEIEWTSTDPTLDLPSLWDWKRIKAPMSLDKVKYVGFTLLYDLNNLIVGWEIKYEYCK